jgi:hypothetical protein
MRKLVVACLIVAGLDAMVAIARAPRSNSSARVGCREATR